jgi:photosystem II stability/assembly factor-like uncharacterized protein
MRRAAAGIVALSAVVGLALGLPAALGHRPVPTSICPGGSDAVQFKDSWTMIKMPAPLAQIETHAAGGLNGKHLLASDGRKVMRSDDGGCTWADSFDVDSVPGEGKPLAGNAPSVALLVFPNGGDRALMVLDGVGRAAASRMMASDDGGKTWKQAGDGLPALGGFRDLVAAPSDGRNLYLRVDFSDTLAEQDTQGVTGALYGSNDGGATWTQRSRGVPIQSLAVDPQSAAELWAVRATHEVVRSKDGGATWSEVTTLPGQAIHWREVALARHNGGPATIVLAASDTAAADVSVIVGSQDDGRTWIPLPTDGLGPIAGLAFGNSPSQILFVSASDSTAFHGPGIHAFDFGQRRWRDIDDEQLIGFREPRSIQLDPVTRGHPGLVGVELRRDAPGEDPPVPDLIARYTPPDPPPTEEPLGRGPVCAPAKGETPSGSRSSGDDLRQDFADRTKPVTFEPGDLSLDLDPGTDFRVPLVAHLPRTLRPLDVYYVIDSTDSMDPVIDAVYCSADRLAYGLQARGLDAWFGAATYRDRHENRYQRLLDLKPYGPELRNVLDGVFTLRGEDEPMRSALFQTATGAGLEVEDGYSDPTGVFNKFHVHIPPGQQADYRDDAVRTAIVMTDEPYTDGVAGEPTREEVVEALTRKHILAIGIAIEPSLRDEALRINNRGLEKTLQLQLQMQYFARGSGAVAPVGGVDCNGDGTPDVRQGDPLVCRAPEQGVRDSMGDTLLSILESFKNPQDVRIVPIVRSGLAVAVEGGALRKADLSHPKDVAGTAVVSCTKQQAGRSYPLSFAVIAGRKTVGTLSGSAGCGALPPRKARPTPRNIAAPPAPPKATPAVAPPPTPHAAALAPPPSPPPSPAPVSSAPAASPASAPASASSPAQSPVGAAAAAPETAPSAQAATVRTDGPSDHAMVAPNRARDDRSTTQAASAVTLGIGAILGTALLVAERGRRRRRPSLARLD